MSKINTLFESFIEEGSNTPQLADNEFAAYQLSEPNHLSQINAWLALYCIKPFVNPYFVLNHLKIKLLICGVEFDEPKITGESGSVTKSVRQFGRPVPFKITFRWMSVKGIYTLDVNIFATGESAQPITEQEISEEDHKKIMDEATKTLQKHNYSLKTNLGNGSSVYTHSQGRKLHIHSHALKGFTFSSNGPQFAQPTSGAGLDSLTAHLQKIHRANASQGIISKRSQYWNK